MYVNNQSEKDSILGERENINYKSMGIAETFYIL